jgi:urea carboxylase system permease
MSAVSDPGSAQRADTDELAKFGYKQELDRSLGSFSSFAAGFSYISILTGVFQLFGLAFLFAGPAFFWSWPIVFIGQMLVALCFAELAGQYPLAGSVYQWSKQTARALTSWMAGWLLLIGSIVTVAAVAVAYQVILPQVTTWFQFVGKTSDAGLTNTPGGAQNAVILAVGLVVFTTIINMIGVKLMARINNVGVAAELVGVALLIILLAVHITRGPDVVFETNGTGAGHDWGYFGAFLTGSIVSVYVMYGFDTAGSLAEETNNPRKHAPPAIIRALAAAGLAGGLLILVAMMAVSSITAKEIGTLGLPFIVKDTLGETLGDFFLIDSAVAITVCCLAVHTAGIRMMFSMARDNRLPLGSAVARVSGKSKTPIVPALVIGGLAIGLLVINIGNQRVFAVLVSVAIILFYLAYMCVTGPLLLARLRGDWPRPDHGPFFSLGRWGLPINIVAVVYQVIAVVNLAWPREEIYGTDHWYFQYGAFVFVGIVAGAGGIYYFIVQRDKPAEPLPEHRAEIDAALAQT